MGDTPEGGQAGRAGPAPRRAVAHAPGRAGILGDHTGPQRGLVLPFALERGITVTAVRTDTPAAEVLALDLAAEDRFPLGDVPGTAPGDWRSHVRGSLSAVGRLAGPLPGMRLTVTGDLPAGAGLASSAALGAAVALAALALGGRAVEPFLLAAVLRRAAWEWAGERAGLADALVLLVARERHALLADMATLDTTDVPMGDARFAVRGAGGGAEAGERVRARAVECAEAARRLALPDLHDATPEEGERLPPPLARRLRHVLSENARVRAGAAALAAGDLPALGRLLDASHCSLRDDFAMSSPTAEEAWQEARREGALGARVTGAGASVVGLWDRPPPRGWTPLVPGRAAWAQVIR